MNVSLNFGEQVVCKTLAKQRYELARKNNRPDQQIGKQSSEQTDLDGIGGEMAASKVLNVYPSLILEPDSGWDIQFNGYKIDVKTTRYKTGRLLAKLNARDEQVDVYLLVTGVFPDYSIRGWVMKEELLDKKNIIDLGHGKGYGLTQDKLNSMESLVA
jgi:hypothetical protein